MKVGQSQVVRWVSKLVSRPGRTATEAKRGELRELSTVQLRQVSGGDGSTAMPTKTW